MKYRRFGRTGLEVSEIVFGAGFVGGLVILKDDETKLAAVRRAVEAGINWFDTAPSYGQGRSEEALGWLLKEVATKPYLSTKVTVDVTSSDDIAGQIEASIANSLKRLGRDSVDLLQLHNPIAAEAAGRAVGVDDVLRRGGIADGLERMRDQGLTRFIGLTALGDAQSCRLAIASSRFDSAQVYYNLLNPSAARAMPAAWSGQDFNGLMATCQAHDVAVMNIRVFAAGIIATDERTGREIPVTPDITIEQEAARARAIFSVLGTRYGSRAQSAVRFALAESAISCVIVGLAELDHLEQAIEAQAQGPLPSEALQEIENLYQSNFQL